MTPAKTNGVGHKAEAVLSTPAETMEQPSENDVSPQARPPQTSTRSRAHKKNHLGPWTRHQVGEPHTPVPSQAGTQEWDHGTERTPKREPPEARGNGNHPRQHRHCRAPTGRRDAIATGKGAATIAMTRRGGASRQPPCRDGKPGHDSSLYRDRQVRRHKVAPDQGDASTDVATQAGRGMLHPGPPTNHTNTHTRGGEHGESCKTIYKTPRAPDPPRWERAQEIPTSNEESISRALLVGMNTSSSLHARSTMSGHHARPSSSPETHKGEKRGGRGHRREREKGRRERGKG
ncbi:hypothetical protein Taro_001075 [Colocasia esculenta]|uniref:Uncharacterized protein n=1 Tax=Colocasia esculenta TaxID=4460 RepID=A0A843TGQ1_COLES|nr:hypothetical protein [Colocasia esculenta]